MRKVYQLHVLVLSVLISVSAKLSAASYTWNGSVSEEWSNSSNWSPAGVPGLPDDVIINGSGAFQPEWEELPGIRNLTISGGTLNLAIFFMPVYGTCNFTGGTVTGGTLVISSANAVFAGTTFNCNVTYTGANAQLNGSVFFGNVSLTKVGGGIVNSTGGNVFHSNVEIINQDDSQFRFETSNADVFNGNVRLRNTSSGGIFMAFSALGTSFNGHIEVNSTGNTGIYFGASGGTSSLATGRNITIGSSGFSSGNLRFAGFSQNGNNRFELNGSGSSRIYFEPGTLFNAVLEFNFPLFYLNGATFNDSLIINKPINGSCTSDGGNVFNGVVVITKSSNSNIRLANLNPDTFNEDVYLADLSGNSGIEMSYAAAGNQFNGDIKLNIVQTGSITFGLNGGTSTLSSGNNIGVFNSGLANGTVLFNKLTQLGGGLITLTQNTGSGQLNFSECIFSASLNIIAPGFALSGSTFNGNVSLSKVGTGDRISSGGNTFNQDLSLINSANGSLTMAQAVRDIYNGNLTINQSGNGFVQMANASANNIFNGAITLNSSGNSLGIRFGQGGGTSTFTASCRPQIGLLGFTRGELGFRFITVEGSNPFDLDISTGTTLGIIADAVINCPLDINIPRILLARSTFNGTVSVRKNGSVNDTWTGGNVFNASANIEIANGYVYSAGSLPETFNGTARIYCSGNGRAYLSHGAAGTFFADDLTLVAGNSTSMILFGQSGGTTNLGSGAMISLSDGINSQGSIRFRNFTQIGAEALSLQTGTTNSSLYFETTSMFNGAINAQAGLIFFNGTTFISASTFTSTGAGTATSNGGNSFANNTSINSSGTGVLVMGNVNPDSFLGQLSLNANGAGARIQLAQTSSGNVFAGPILLSSINGAGGIRFCNNNGTATLESGAYFSTSGAGFNSGDLNLRRITQNGTDAHTLNLTGTASSVTFLTANIFAGNMTCTAPLIYLNGSRFNGTNSFEQFGATNINSTGGNYFQGTTQLTLSGTGAWYHSISAFDTYNSNLIVRVNNSSGILYMAHAVAGTTVNGNIQLISTNGTGGIRFCQGTSGSLSLTGSFSIGAGGFNAGDIRIRRTTQTGLSANSLVVTGTSTSVYFEQTNIFTGNMTCRAPQVYLNGSRFNGVNSFEQTGATSISSTGGNNFQGATQLTLSGTGPWLHATTSPDAYNSNVTLKIDNSSGILYMSHAVAGTTVNGNIQLISTNGTGGIRFGQGANGSLSLTGSISLGAEGFNAGDIRMRRVAQSGLTANSLVLTGSGTAIYFEQLSSFTANTTATAGSLYLNGSQFAGATFTQNGSVNTVSNGGNTFTGAVTINQSGTGYLLLGNALPDVFNNTLTATNTSSSIMYLAHTSSGNQFRGNVTLTSTGSSQGIFFGQANGSSTLASGASFAFGGSGFTNGALRIRNLVQSGSTAISLSSTSTTAQIYLETGTSFSGNVTVSSRSLFLNGATFNGTATLTNSGTTTITSTGGNTFNGSATILSTGTGEWRLASTNSDIYNGDVIFRSTVANRLFVAYGSAVNINRNISTVGSTFAITFAPANNNGWIIFGGSLAQTISADATRLPVIPNLMINKSANGLTLNRQVSITRNLAFVSGHITSSAANLLVVEDNALVTGASSTSYVNGPVRKVGNDAFSFPTGKNGIFRPISISAPSNTTHHFTAELFRETSNGSYSHASKVASIQTISQCEYWVLNRTNGTSNVNVTLSWNGSECLVTNPSTLVVARWNGTSWQNHGNGGTTGSAVSGTVISSAAITSFSPFALASTSIENPLPVELISFNGEIQSGSVKLKWETASETNSHYFEIEKSTDLLNFTSLGKVNSAGTTTQHNYYDLTDHNPYSGVSYYRLIQVDFNGSTTIYDPISVNNLESSELEWNIWPNPTEGVLNLSLSHKINAEECDIKIINSLGNLVKATKFNPNDINQINLEDLSAGVYSILITGNNIRYTKKIIKK